MRKGGLGMRETVREGGGSIEVTVEVRGGVLSWREGSSKKESFCLEWEEGKEKEGSVRVGDLLELGGGEAVRGGGLVVLKVK